MKTPTDSVPIRVEIDPENIFRLVGLLESYETFAVVRTVDRDRGHVELMSSPDFVDEIHALLESLKNEMSLKVLS